jgi:hypothetical protein
MKKVNSMKKVNNLEKLKEMSLRNKGLSEGELVLLINNSKTLKDSPLLFEFKKFYDRFPSGKTVTLIHESEELFEIRYSIGISNAWSLTSQRARDAFYDGNTNIIYTPTKIYVGKEEIIKAFNEDKSLKGYKIDSLSEILGI